MISGLIIFIPNTKILKLTILNVKQETKDVKTYTLCYADGSPITYEAGQFITLISQHTGIEERRSYSFSSSPMVHEQPAITVKRIDNGIMSRFLFDRVQPRDIIDCVEPGGFFTLQNAEKIKDLFFFAAGVGITPIFSLIKTALILHPHQRITLIYSNRSIADTLFYNELEELKTRYKSRFKIEYLFSTASDLSRARLSKTLLPAILKKTSYDKQTHFYVCGPFPYMRMVILGLEEAGIAGDKIKKENFNTNVITRIIKPPDENAHTVEILYNNSQYIFTSQYPDTILRSARKNNIILPYSCENGICGICAAQCTKGNVWHRNNEVLTDAELAKGMVLTCVGYPINGDVTINLNKR